MFQKASRYIAEVKGELKKTSWPWDSNPKVKGFKKYRELFSSTVVVLLAMLFLGALVGMCDLGLTKVLDAVISSIR